MISDDLPFKNKIEPISKNSHPYHLGAHIMTEMEPEGEINGENITGVTHSRHEVQEVVVFPVVVLEVLYDQHPTTVDKIHLRLTSFSHQSKHHEPLLPLR